MVLELLRRPARVSALLTVGLIALPAIPDVSCAQAFPLQASADSLLAQGKWREAAEAYTALTNGDPANGAAWTNLGESQLRQRKFSEAIAAFAQAESLKYRPFINVINQARVEAARRDDGRTFQLLQRVVDGGAGGALRSLILGATEFSWLAADARWSRLVEQLKPCTTAPYREFDFWIGDWDVYLPDGKPAGHNVVTVEQAGCLLVEHWTGTGGGTGTSFNYYDVRDRHWHQLYIDNSGNAGAFPAMGGTFTDGKMVLLTDDANKRLSRWTWFVMEPGKVKQMAELSTDHGKTWQITWNSVYVPSVKKE